MADVTFLIPEKGDEHARELQGVAGIEAIHMAQKPFDPFSADAETQVVAETVVTVSYDPAQTTVRQIRDALHAHGVHVLDVLKGE